MVSTAGAPSSTEDLTKSQDWPRGAISEMSRASQGTQTTHSACGAEHHLCVASLQYGAVLLPSIAQEIGALSAVKAIPQGANVSHSLLSRPAASFEDKWY